MEYLIAEWTARAAHAAEVGVLRLLGLSPVLAWEDLSAPVRANRVQEMLLIQRGLEGEALYDALMSEMGIPPAAADEHRHLPRVREMMDLRRLVALNLIDTYEVLKDGG